MRVNNSLFVILGAVLVGGALISLSSCRGKGKVADAPAVERVDDATVRLTAEALKNIKVARIGMGEFPDQLSLMGRISVTEDRVAVVPARIAGRIDGVYVASGEQVGKDQLLASLFSADYAIAREEYLQALAQSKSGVDENLLAMSRKKLTAMGMSPGDIDKLPIDKNTTNLMIRAPLTGALLDKKAIIGNVVNVGDTLFTIGNLNKVWFAGDIYPEDLSKVHKSQEVIIAPVGGGERIHGTVSFISPVVDPTTRTIKIRALMDNPEASLRADMYVQGNLILSKRTALLVPSGALVRLRDTTFAFRKTEDGMFRKVQVEVEKEQSGMAVVGKGLTDGDEIVTEGGLLLDGALSAKE